MRNISEILEGTGYKSTDLEIFLAKCDFDFIYFAEHVMGFEIAPYHKEWFELAETWPRLNLPAYRGSGKTCFFAAYFIWKAIVYKRGLNFLITSNTFEQAKIVLKLIRQMVADNELLKVFIPEGKESTWKATELTFNTGATFYCRTYGSNTKGLRIDYMLCDEAGQYEDKSVFWIALTPVVQLNRGRIIVLGTKESEIDLISELEDNDEYMSKEYPVEIDGKPLWPQKYTMEEQDTDTQRSIQKIKKEMGDLQFEQEFMLHPISSANSLFPYEITVPNCANEKKFLPYGKIDVRYYIGYDYALSPTGDWVVMTVIAVNADRKELVHALRFRGTSEQQREQLRTLVNNFKPLKICVDATGLGEDQAIQLQKEFSNVEAVKITYEEKMKMLLDLRQEFIKMNLILPNSKEDPRTYNFTQEFLKEGNEFTLQQDFRAGASTRSKFHSGKYDDCVLSLALANRASLNEFGTISISSMESEN
jgi:hypothetical protein